MEHQLVAAAIWSPPVVALVVAVLLVRQWQISARLRGRVAELEGEGRWREEEARHLVTSRLPALAESLYERPIEVPGPLHESLTATPYGRSLESVMGMFTESFERARLRADLSAKATLKSMMRGVQSLANEQQLAISLMQERHDDPDVLEDLLKIDHMNAQLGRRAQATAVLCGSWPGQQRSASSLTDVVRGATSRIRDYLRVQVHPHASVAVVSRVVEPVVLAVAEVLDNAARHSQPTTSVEVNFQPAHNGTAIVIDDAGVAMNPEELRRAARLLSGEESVDINRLGDPPQIGFAVVGVLAARYGFSVSVDTRSPYGGVRAVVFLPTALLTRASSVPAATRTEPAPAALAVPDALAVPVPDAPPEPPRTTSGLPRRRRVSAEPARASDGPSSDARPSPDDQGEKDETSSPSERARRAATGMGAWQRGTRSGRATAAPDPEGNPQA